MGIRFYCPNGHKLNVKAFLAGKRGICPHCDSRFEIPHESQIPEDAPKLKPAPLPGDQSATSVATAVQVASAEPAAPVPATAVREAAPTDDPIAEAPDAVWYVRPPAGGQFGPARGEVMRQWLGEGRVSADSMVWREGWSDWKTAGPVFPELDQAFVSSPKLQVSSAAAAEQSIRPPNLSSVEDPGPPEIRSKPVVGARGRNKSIALVVCLGLLIVVLLVVLVMVLQVW